MKNRFKKIILLLLLATVFTSCKIKGELLSVTRAKGGHPPVLVSNYFAISNDFGIEFPKYKLAVCSCNDKIVYYKNEKIYDSNKFPQFKRETVELYKNTILLITERKGGDVPMTIWRKETLFIELENPQFYYLVKFENPINIISSEIVRILIKSQKKLTKSEFLLTIDNFYSIANIDLEEQTILLKKVHHVNGIYSFGTEQEDLKLKLVKYKNPIFTQSDLLYFGCL